MIHALTGTWANTSCPTSGMSFCRTPNHSTPGNPGLPFPQKGQPPFPSHIKGEHLFFIKLVNMVLLPPLGMSIHPPFPLSTSVHYTELVPSGVSRYFIHLFSLTFLHRLDEASSVWSQ